MHRLRSQENQSTQPNFYHKNKTIIIIILILLVIGGYFIINNKKQKISVVFLAQSQQSQFFPNSIKAFQQINSYPIERTILIINGKITKGFQQKIKSLEKVTILSTGKKIGQLKALDKGLRLVETPYVYFSQDKWKLKQEGSKIIQQSIKALKSDQKLLQMSSFASNQQGFSFKPFVMRVNDIKKLKDGKFSSYEQSSSINTSQKLLRQKFKDLGYFTSSLKKEYYTQLAK